MLDITQIMAFIQHRYPFLLVDRIEDFEPYTRVVGVKNVTMNEHVLQGHLPGAPSLPPVLIIEHAAQIGCVLLLSNPANAGKLGIFTGMDEVQFLRPVVPGDQLRTEVTMLRAGSRGGKVRFVSRVGNEVAVEGCYSFLLVPDPTKTAEA